MDHWRCCVVRGSKETSHAYAEEAEWQGEIKDHAPVEGLHEEATKAPNDQAQGDSRVKQSYCSTAFLRWEGFV